MARGLKWAVAGSLWGLLSLGRGLLPEQYFALFGSAVGSAVQWVLPMWWVVQLDEALGQPVLGSWLPALYAASVLAGAGVALALWSVIERLRAVRHQRAAG